MARITNKLVMLRVGGGWTTLQAYIKKYEEEQREKLRRIIIQNRFCYEQAIFDLVVKFEAEEKV